jgi:NADPH-dependent 2,4-dienoyl-CoA reductase/sulfur reductase-like enzyme/rhodanese-related sulfurtransferase
VEDAEAIRTHLSRPLAKDVVIVGAGLLGCQICDSVSMRGARLTLVEERPLILQPLFDEELSALVRGHLEANGIRVLCSQTADRFEGDERVEAVHLNDGSRLPCDFVILSLGRRPEVELARSAGLAIGATGAIRVDRHLRTDDPDIFAAGDCAEQVHAITGEAVWFPGAVPAALQGRVAANNVCGLNEESPPVAGTTVVRLFDWTVARTGLTERGAKEAGFEPLSVLTPGPDRAHFIPTARNFVLKLVVDRNSGRVLGAQGVGPGEVAKRIDVVATALATGMDVDGLARLHLAYAPSYSMVIDNVIAAANVLRDKRDGRLQGISPVGLRQRMLAGNTPLLLDVRQPMEYAEVRLRGSRHIPLGSLRGRLNELPRDETIVVVCSIGLRSYEASLILKANGFEDVWVLDGGLQSWPYPVERLT